VNIIPAPYYAKDTTEEKIWTLSVPLDEEVNEIHYHKCYESIRGHGKVLVD
jgi:hypothetical protein